MRVYVKKVEPGLAVSNAKVEETVRGMLSEIRDRGDEAVRKYARNLDQWDREFRVSEDEIRQASAQLPETFKDDFDICKRQIQEFAKRQLDSLAEIEVEISPGVVLGHKHIPVEKVGCYIPGGKYPLVSAAKRNLWSDALWFERGGGRRNLLHRWCPGHGRHGLWSRRHGAGRHDHRSR